MSFIIVNDVFVLECSHIQVWQLGVDIFEYNIQSDLKVIDDSNLVHDFIDLSQRSQYFF